MLEAHDGARDGASLSIFTVRSGDVSGEIAHALKISGDANVADELAQVHAPVGRCARIVITVDTSISRSQPVEARVDRNDLVGKRGVRVGERVHGVDHHFLSEAAHFRNAALDRVELLVVGFDRMFDHGAYSLSRTGR